MTKRFSLTCFLLAALLASVWLGLHGVYAAGPTDSYTLLGNEDVLANDILITIDDCSIESNVRWAFELLKRRGVKATFFPNTKWMKKQDPKLWQAIVAAGFEIGYHTRLHTPGMTPDQLNADFDRFQQEVRQILNDPNYTIHFVRPPGGLWNADWRNWAALRNLMTVKWNFVAPTITLPYVQGVIYNHQRGGTILLMHTGLADVRWLSKNIDGLMRLRDAQGHRFHLTTLSDAFDDDAPSVQG
jgi:peptidoglycan/xylan/chitin deacetylase (PgdA/CDA1 family)